METQTSTQVDETVVPEVQENTEVKPSETPEAPTEVKPSENEIEARKEAARQKVEKRIHDLTAKRYEEKARADRLEAELAEYRKTQGNRPSRPSMTQFADEYGNVDHAKYDAAMVAYDDSLLTWKDRQRSQTEAEVNAKIEQETAFEKFNVVAETARAKYADFDEVINKKVYSPELQKALLEDQLVEVTYYLGKNENEALRLSQMPYHQMMKELGKLEGKLSTLTLKASRAPEPIRPVEGEKGIEVTDDSKLSDKEWFAKEEKKRLEKVKKQWSQ